MEPLNVFNSNERQQFQVLKDGELASLEYRLSNGMIVLMHTEVPENLGGHGIGSALAEYAFKYARANHLPVKVYCPFVQAYLKRHPEYQDLIVKAD
ncbi:MAG TPA: GNAT family N-acetyltransferase [Puia sp.]|nr:GNAT family N-acetyltransferase [Puia sp.]